VILATAACWAVGPAAAAQRSPKRAAADPRPVISVWTQTQATSSEFSALDASASLFNRTQRRYRVDILPSIYKSYEERIENAAATGALPCLLAVDNPFVHPFAWRGYLQSIDRFVTPALLRDLLPSVVAEGKYEKRQYTLAQFDSGLGLWGNRRYLEKAGITIPTVARPWDLAAFEKALASLSALSEIEYALSLSVHATTSEFYAYAYAPIVQGFGGDLVDRVKGFAAGVLDGPRSIAAMTRFQYWFKQGWTKPVFDRANDFEAHRAALAWTGHWKYSPFRTALGNDLVLMPLPDFGRGVKTGMGSWGWGISSTCRYPEGAWAFLSFLLTPTEILRATEVNGAVPARYSVLARSPLYGARGPLRVFAQQLMLGFAVARPSTPGYGAIRTAFSDAVRAIIGGADVETELTKAARVIDDDVARHRGYPRR
jgi:multiple sugar transport system substrate-binding protein